MTIAPTTRSVLAVLTKARMVEIARDLGVALPAAPTKEGQVEALLRRTDIPLPSLLSTLGRDELKAACRSHGLDDAGRSRTELAARLVQASSGAAASLPTGAASVPPPSAPEPTAPRLTPQEGDIVAVRHRQYLVSSVLPPTSPGEMTIVRLVCLDDDAQGRPLEVLWELELGARILAPEAHGLGKIDRLDRPRDFAAYFHALKWSRITATDGRLFQAPFRAGIMLKDYQLTPLMKALELPRANLFIADDVGLGKTIEAGLVLQELLLRQRVDWALILCPAPVALQWKGEMERRFGLRFEIYSRELVARRRQERGFGVNPWSTHNRFIISYQTFRRPEHRDPLLHFFGSRKRKKSLLILDEAHTAAPASATKYAVDSAITRTVRDTAPLFEHRLFLSATPHNGHSNSFSALLEILDPQRFLRGTPISGREQLRPAMVRRLKSDILALNRGDFPDRRLVQIDLTHNAGAWTIQAVDQAGPPGKPEILGNGPPVELELSTMLAEYTRLMAPKKGPGRLVFINLQKRLLSSVEAFARTLEKHAARFDGEAAGPAAAVVQNDSRGDAAAEEEEDEAGIDAESEEDRADAEIARVSRHLTSPSGRARELLDTMRTTAQQHRAVADAKVRALVDWIRKHQCPAVELGGARLEGARARGAWTERRLIVFTEYGHTKAYLRRILGTAVEGTHRGDERIRVFDGGMSEENRYALQQEFNGPPAENPVRILIATDAAREGVNLQGHCQDLFHFDIPWNPARMEQRNGRIDRALQPEREVRCMYFVYPQRTEDEVLRSVVKKIDRIKKELGSLGSVVMDRLEAVLARGIDDRTLADVEGAEQMGLFREVVTRELESQRVETRELALEIDEAGKILNRSRKLLEFDPALLRDAIEVGLGWAGAASAGAADRLGSASAGAGKLAPAPPPAGEEKLPAFTLPAMDDTWQATLDTVRSPRRRDESVAEWQKRPLLPVVFEPPKSLGTQVAHLHLSHPFVQRILARFLAQGHAAHDLSRVTAVRNPKDSVSRVIAFGRLSIFGPGAARLHDQLVSVASAWRASGGPRDLVPFGDEEDRRSIERLEDLFAAAPELDAIDARTLEDVQKSAPAHFAALWPHIEAEADAIAHEAERQLRARGKTEADALRALLTSQLDAARRVLDGHQLAFDFGEKEAAEREQLLEDRKFLRERLGSLKREIEREPREIEASYEIVRRRLEPVGLVYLVAGTR